MDLKDILKDDYEKFEKYFYNIFANKFGDNSYNIFMGKIYNIAIMFLEEFRNQGYKNIDYDKVSKSMYKDDSIPIFSEIIANELKSKNKNHHKINIFPDFAFYCGPEIQLLLEKGSNAFVDTLKKEKSIAEKYSDSTLICRSFCYICRTTPFAITSPSRLDSKFMLSFDNPDDYTDYDYKNNMLKANELVEKLRLIYKNDISHNSTVYGLFNNIKQYPSDYIHTKINYEEKDENIFMKTKYNSKGISTIFTIRTMDNSIMPFIFMPKLSDNDCKKIIKQIINLSNISNKEIYIEKIANNNLINCYNLLTDIINIFILKEFCDKSKIECNINTKIDKNFADNKYVNELVKNITLNKNYISSNKIGEILKPYTLCYNSYNSNKIDKNFAETFIYEQANSIEESLCNIEIGVHKLVHYHANGENSLDVIQKKLNKYNISVLDFIPWILVFHDAGYIEFINDVYEDKNKIQYIKPTHSALQLMPRMYKDYLPILNEIHLRLLRMGLKNSITFFEKDLNTFLINYSNHFNTNKIDVIKNLNDEKFIKSILKFQQEIFKSNQRLYDFFYLLDDKEKNIQKTWKKIFHSIMY